MKAEVGAPAGPDGVAVASTSAMPALANGDLFELLERAVSEFPDRPHLTYLGATLTYRQTHALSLRLAGGLKRHGMVEGDRVGICLPNMPAYVILCFALWRMGAVGVGMNALYSERHLSGQLADAGIKLVFAVEDDVALAKVRGAAGAAGCDLLTCSADGADLAARHDAVSTSGLGTLLSAAPLGAEHRRPAPGDLAMLQYTGGTTGTPKGAMMTHASLLDATAQGMAWMSQIERGADVWHGPAPLSHISGLIIYACIVTAAAGECLLVARFQPAELLGQLRSGRPTIITVIPTMLTALMSLPDLSGIDWARLKYILAGGAPTPLELQAQVKAATGLSVLQSYGMTETCGTAVGMPANAPVERWDATGVPLRGVSIEIRSLEDPSRRMAPGERGEICIGGKNVMAGYWKAGDSTAHLTPDGLLRSGDIGTMTPDGYLYVVDRLKDLVICSGYNVYPRVIDEAVLQHPAIHEAISLGVPDSYRGETIMVAAALKPGESLTLEGLQAFLSDRLSPIEMPKRLQILDALPKSENGKLSRQLVRATLLAAEGGSSR